MAKLKSLTAAMEIMAETRHAFRLIRSELLEEQMEVSSRGARRERAPSVFATLHFPPPSLLPPSPALQLADPGSGGPEAAGGPPAGLNLQEVMKLIAVFEPSFSFLLLQLIKLMTTMKRKPR